MTTTTQPDLTEHVLAVWDNKLRLRVKVAGHGPALVYLHPAAGLMWDDFLSRLAQDYTVYAPEFPGTSPADPYAIHQVDDLWQVILIYEEALRKLDIDTPTLVGQSFGGMLAAELAACYPDRFNKLVLLDPIGLWCDEQPVINWIALPPSDLPALIFADPDGPAAKAMFDPPADPEEAIAAGAGMVWATGCTGKFVWPIPDKGLQHRLHRITAPTLIVWGELDKLIPASYADEFAARITGSKISIIPQSGHIPQLEQTEATYSVVHEFLT
jgi:pimeloyl-ACP methyl ester carboxylesterase